MGKKKMLCQIYLDVSFAFEFSFILHVIENQFQNIRGKLVNICINQYTKFGLYSQLQHQLMRHPQPKLVHLAVYWNPRAPKTTDGKYIVHQCNYCKYVNHQKAIVLKHQLYCFFTWKSQSDENLQESSPRQLDSEDKAKLKQEKCVQNNIKNKREGKHIEKIEKEEKGLNESKEEKEKNGEQEEKNEDQIFKLFIKRESKRKSLQKKMDEKVEQPRSPIAKTQVKLPVITLDMQVQTDPEIKVQQNKRCNLI